MFPISFRIKNYKSIIDSGECYLSGDNVTILAGKNEAGKTTILEALEDFNVDKAIEEKAIPIHEPESKPQILITFKPNEDEIETIFANYNLKPPKNNNLKIQIIKSYPNQYSLSPQSIKLISGMVDKDLTKLMLSIDSKYKKIRRVCSKIPSAKENLPTLTLEMIAEGTKEEYDIFISELTRAVGELSEEDIQEKIKDNLSEITDLFNEISQMSMDESNIQEEIKKLIPNFIFFNSFDDELPSEIAISSANSNELIKDLDIISDLDLDTIQSGSINAKMKHKEQLNIRMKQDYREYWTQDLTNLHIDWDSQNLFFLIKEGDNFYPPNIRSKGKQWHLAFYIRISARSKEDVQNIILIDEPGLYLHAKAQTDILKKLGDSSKDSPIIFSTHSPFLIEIDRLNRIRLINRTESEGTTISNKIHKGADKETLTPIIAAIGLDLSLGLDVAKDNNLLLEGISDYYYLLGFIEILKFKFNKEIHLIPCVGADKFNFLIPLMGGWGLNFGVLVDNDKKGRKIDESLKKNFGHWKLNITKVSTVEDYEIEDLFDREDFAKKVLNTEISELPSTLSNSELVKQKNNEFDKVLLSKLFYEKAKKGDISLSKVTMDNFNTLLNNINSSMFSS